jgi:dCTP deaminase
MLSDRDIDRALSEGGIFINPFQHKDLQPASVDLHLAPIYRRWRVGGIDSMWKNLPIDVNDIPIDYTYLLEVPKKGITGILLKPGEMILASTIECVGINRLYAARVEGRSSLGRIGVMTHITAGFIDPGFKGNITLEIVNVSPTIIRLEAGMRIAQIGFYRLDTITTRSYSAKGGNSYVGERADGPVPAKGDIR